MRTSKRKLREEITKLTYRVHELEEKLCPGEDHDWELIISSYHMDSAGEYIETLYTHECRRCGKYKQSNRIL